MVRSDKPSEGIAKQRKTEQKAKPAERSNGYPVPKQQLAQKPERPAS